MLRARIYNNIRERLKATVPSLALVDMQRRQIERSTSDYPIPLPAVYLSFGTITWSGGDGCHYGTTNLIVDVYLDNHGDTYDTAENCDDNATALLQWSNTIYEALQGYSCDGMQPLSRVQEDMSVEDAYVHIQVQFSTMLIEEMVTQGVATAAKPAMQLDNTVVNKEKEARRGVGSYIVERNLKVK